MRVPMEYDHFGYEFLDIVPGGKIHSGWDLNWGNSPDADFGKPIYCMTEGEVVYSANAGTGWGNLIVIYHPSIKMWTRYGHSDKRFVKVGDYVPEDTIIASCGKSGTSSVHCHFDLIKKKLSYWTEYTKGWTQSKVLEYYEDGLKFIQEWSDSDKEVIERVMRLNSANWNKLDGIKQLPEVLKAKDFLHLSNEELRKIT